MMRHRWMRGVPLLAVLALAGVATAAAPALKPLSAQDIPALLKPPVHGERLIMFWALNCAYCEPNMEALAKLQRAHPDDIELVLVNTDDIVHRKKIEAGLRQAGMTAYPAWAYTEVTPERLNYLVDPTWGGETPRTLAILADGRKAAVSGELTQKELAQLWPLPAAASQAGHARHMQGMQNMSHAGNVAATDPPPPAPQALHIDKAWVRLLPGKLPAGGYFVLHNDGDTSMRLTGASSPVYGMAMLHKSEESSGLSSMVHVKAVTVPAHGSVRFAPGGYHLMLMHAKKPLRVGGTIKVILHFADGSQLTAPFKLRPAAATGP